MTGGEPGPSVPGGATRLTKIRDSSAKVGVRTARPTAAHSNCWSVTLQLSRRSGCHSCPGERIVFHAHAERRRHAFAELQLILQIHRPLMQCPIGRVECQLERGGGLEIYVAIKRAGRDGVSAPV